MVLTDLGKRSLWTQQKQPPVLFDFDGVVVDTETQYSHFWHEMGKQYLGMDDIEGRVKGQTLVYIYDTFFPGMAKEQAEITERLNRFEQEMSFDFIPGVLDFIADLHRNGVKTAVVTSSNEAKMAAVYRVHPEIKTLFDRILTAEMFTASKPAPDCFLLGDGGFRHNSRHHICIRGFFQRAESWHGFRSYRYRVGNHQFP